MRTMTRALAFVSTLTGLSYVASADEGKHKQHKAMQDETGEKGERALQRVYFEFDSAAPTDNLLLVANNLECTPNETIILDAYADPVGPEDYNADLALRRAQMVRDKLVEYGIDKDRIMLGIFGEPDQVDSHQLARRVEVRTSDEPIATLRQRREGEAVAVVAPGEELEQVARP